MPRQKKTQAQQTFAGLEKCPTGIRGLDEITKGGLPRGHPTMIDEHGLSVLPISSLGLDYGVSRERISTGIDLLKNPQLARGDQILAVPTLVRKLPEPLRCFIGSMANKERILVGRAWICGPRRRRRNEKNGKTMFLNPKHQIPNPKQIENSKSQ